MNRIAICTFARSEYGLLRQVIRKCHDLFETRLIAGGWHLHRNAGNSIHEILDDRILDPGQIHVLPFFDEAETLINPGEVLSRGISVMHQHLAEHPCDLLVLMGDRHELFAATLAAMHHRIPVAHISGGEISEGAIDDNIRHATTKLSHLHLVANLQCAQRVSSMGEEDWRIVVTGEPGLDAIHSGDMATSDELLHLFGVDVKQPLMLVTLHPATMEPQVSLQEQYIPLSEVIQGMTDFRVVITAPAPEDGASELVSAWQALSASNSHVSYIPHLGSRNYLAIMDRASVVVGNSSSGLTEAPSLGVASVNMGGRQRGRMAAGSVIHCGYGADEILHAIHQALSEEHQNSIKDVINPYDPYRDGLNSHRVALAISRFLKLPYDQRIVKKFDLQTDVNQWDTLLNP